MGQLSDVDADKVYDYHTAFDIKPTEVSYNVDINLKQKRFLMLSWTKQGL